MSALAILTADIDAMSLSGPDTTEVRMKAYALREHLAAMAPEEREPYVHGFYQRFFEEAVPGRAFRIVADYLRPFLVELVRSRGQTALGTNATLARLIDELYDAADPDSLSAMLTLTPCEAILMYAIRKFPVRDQPAAVEILRANRVRPLGLRAVGAAFYHPSVVRWMVEGFIDRLRDRPETLACPEINPPTLSASPLLRHMDTVYQLHRQGFFDRAQLNEWWSSMLRALRPVADRLAPVDAFFVDQGDPVGLVDSVFSLVQATDGRD